VGLTGRAQILSDDVEASRAMQIHKRQKTWSHGTTREAQEQQISV